MPIDLLDNNDIQRLISFVHWYKVAQKRNLEVEFVCSFLNEYEQEFDFNDSLSEAICEWDL